MRLVAQTKGHYRPDIDGLRAIAVIVVVLHHISTDWMPGGFIGVDVFFVISGYLITGIITREIAEGAFTFARFYERRIRRLFPALFAVLAFVLVAGWFVFLPGDYLATLRASAATLLFSANILFWRVQTDYFAADAKLNPLLHMWSLGVEEQFYLLFPGMLLLIRRWGARWLFPAMLAGFFLSLALSIVFTPTRFVASYFLLPTRAWELLAGGLLAVLRLRLNGPRYLRELLALAALSAIFISAFQYTQQTPFPGYAALLPVLGTAALIWLGGGEPTAVNRLLQLRPVVYVGLISYSLYLWHWPLIVFARFLNGLKPLGFWGFAVFLLSIALAALSHRYVERPFREGRPMRRARVFSAAGAATAVVLVFCALGIRQDGFDHRMSAEVAMLDRQGRAEVPFKDCDGKLEGCTIGAGADAVAGKKIVFWGDSHVLAWAPAIDKVLRKHRARAVLFKTSSCPPILGVENGIFPACEKQNEILSRNLEHVDAVVMTAYWWQYQDGIGNSGAHLRSGNASLLGVGLPGTIRRLLDNGVDVYLIGPVPTYKESIPYAFAASAMSGVKEPHGKSVDEHYRDNRQFYEIAAKLPSSVHFIDPAKWICTPVCALGQGHQLFYRDSNHLSVFGALRYGAQLERELSPLFSSEQPSGRRG